MTGRDPFSVTLRPSEGELTAAVLAAARLLGWRTAHFRPARTAHGWRTPVQGDGAGFPDLLLAHPRQARLLFRELKAGSPLRPEQAVWAEALEACGCDWGIWRPDDWTSGAVEAALRGLAS